MTRPALALGLATLGSAASPAGAQVEVERTWVAKDDGVPSLGFSPRDEVTDLGVRDGCVYVTGYESQVAANSNDTTAKYDHSGAPDRLPKLDHQIQEVP